MFALQLILAICLILFLPGYLLNRLLLPGKHREALESIAYAFGTSLAVNTMICLAMFAAHGNVHLAVGVHLAITGLLLIGVLLREPWRAGVFRAWAERWPRGRDVALAVPTYLAVAAIVVLGYRVEAPNLGQEDCVTLIMAQKCRAASAWHFDHLLFKPGDTSAYLLSVYSYLLAQISCVSGLEVVQVYCKLRFVFALLALATTWSLARVLFPGQRELPCMVVWCACASVVQGWGSQYWRAPYGQFFPFTQYYDFAICVVLPVALLLFIQGLQGSAAYAVLCVLVTASLFFIHAREAVLLLMLYTGALAGLSLRQPERRPLVRGFGIVAAVGALGILYKVVVGWYVDPEVLSFDHDCCRPALKQLNKLLHGGDVIGWFYPPLDRTQINPSMCLFYEQPYYLLAAAAIPFMLVSRSRGAIIIGGALLAIILVCCVPLLSLLLLRATYSQFFFGGPADLGMFPLVYLVPGLALSGVARCSARLLGLAARWQDRSLLLLVLVIAVGLGLSVVLDAAPRVYAASPLLFYGWVYGGGTLALATGSWLRRRLPERSILPTRPVPRWCLAAVMVAFVGVCALQAGNEDRPTPLAGSCQPRSFAAIFREARAHPPVSKWRSWLAQGKFAGTSWEAVLFMRQSLPEHAVVAAPWEDLQRLAVLINQHVYTSGSYISLLETDFFTRLYRLRFGGSLTEKLRDERFRTTYLTNRFPDGLACHPAVQFRHAMVYFCDDLMRDHQPIFTETDSVEESLRFIREFGIEYVYISPRYLPRLRGLFSARPDRFELLFCKNEYAIYRVKPAEEWQAILPAWRN